MYIEFIIPLFQCTEINEQKRIEWKIKKNIYNTTQNILVYDKTHIFNLYSLFPLHLSLVWRHACNLNWSTHSYDSYRMNKFGFSTSLFCRHIFLFFQTNRTLSIETAWFFSLLLNDCIERSVPITHIHLTIVNGSSTLLSVVLESISS